MWRLRNMGGMNTVEELIREIPKIERKLGYVFRDSSILTLAFIHCSYVNENRQVIEHNERLEFLGDSVLGLLVAEYLYCRFPEKPEGELSRMRADLVEASSCLSYLNKLDIDEYVLLGRGERMNRGRGRDSILADLFEGVIAAIYMDGGIEAAKRFFFETFEEEITQILEEPEQNWKAILQDYCQKNYRETPTYELMKEEGPDHAKYFHVAVRIHDRELGRGEGLSKKEAQQEAAKQALESIEKGERQRGD